MNGYKTYIIGIGAILTAIGAHASGSLPMDQMLQACLTAVLSMTIRHGIATKE